ncbi:hypothetical protein CQA53_06260 [Helicobacter didelphidarum]|uniref:Uncharacterized protein n=1 Tax=Helicobacter didelphidarum TaxID=2040648 RepID=A0A3D8IL69_9HELI|nr:hypothetical protein [Helicobacter didelphidarum]RDU65374.1 hypothetical protein CQA53_06260 [Helicobacter didelphidarum]
MKELEEYKPILKQIYTIEERKNILPLDILGRTLAYNSFLPRLSDVEYLYQNFRVYDKSPSDKNSLQYEKQSLKTSQINNNHTPVSTHKGVSIQLDNLTTILQQATIGDNSHLEKEILCIFIDDKGTNQDNLIDSISALRRLMPVFIGYKGVIIDTYQILELAISGADMFVLDCNALRLFIDILSYAQTEKLPLDSINTESFFEHLQQTKHKKDSKKMLSTLFNNLIAFGNNLGLVPIIQLQDKNDVKMLLSLKNPIDCVLCPPNLISLLPNSYLIFSLLQDSVSKDRSPTKHDVGLQNYQGIDVLLEQVYK